MLLAKLFDNVSIEGAGTVDALMDKIDADDPPDIILLDLLMPGMQGMQGLDAIRHRVPDVPVAIISALSDVDVIMTAIQSGASGFILKSSDEKVLKLAISLMLSGETYVPSHVLRHRDGFWPGKSRNLRSEFPSGNSLASLTERERRILHLLMRGQSNKEIARNLDVVEGTIKKHLRDIFKKLNVSNRTQAVITATQLGWMSKYGEVAQKSAIASE
jgi:DNA-binding NarL/FixJ family response regulator